jgi:hypothetical protein
MSAKRNQLDFAVRQGVRCAEREQIAHDLRAAIQTPEQIAIEHQPFASLKPEQIRVRLDLAKRLA